MILFLHIPKTAGKTFSELLLRKFGNRKSISLNPSEIEYYLSFDNQYFNDIINEFNSNKEETKVIFGHFKFGLHQKLKTNFDYLTFLREPYKHYISMYNHFLKDDHFLGYQENTYRDLNRFMELQITHNLQCYLISGIENHQDIFNQPQKVLETAKANLQTHFTFIGITERFDESMVLLAHTMQWGNRYYIKKNVRHSERLQIDYVTQKKIQDIITLDRELYEFVRENFEKQISEIPNFKFKLFKFKVVNALFQLIFPCINGISTGIKKIIGTYFQLKKRIGICKT